MGIMANKLDMAENDRQREDAAFEMMMDALAEDRRERRKTRRMCIACATVCVVSFLLFVGVLGFLAAGIQIETTTTEETVTQETSGEGDAVYQAGDGSSFYADGGTN